MGEWKYPTEWSTRPLLALADYHNGLAFKEHDLGDEGTRVIRIEQLNNPNGSYDRVSGWFSSQNEISDDDLIFSWSATLKVAIWRHGPAVLNQHLFKVVPRDGVDKCFLYHLLDSRMDALGGSSQGSTMRHVTRRELSVHLVTFPDDIFEQQKIARILTTVDDLIERTEALIAKYEAIKQGLMHDLFTRGVDENGELRPPREEAPHLYKESPLGWIPKKWEVEPLSSFSIFVTYGFTNPMPEADEGPLMVTAADVVGGQIQIETCRRTTAEAFNTLLTDKSKPQRDDILLTKDGTLGRAALVGSERLCVNQSVAVIRPKPEQNAKFLKLLLESPDCQQRLLADAGGSTIKHLYITVVDAMLIAVPATHEEQLAVAQRIDSIHEYLTREQLRLEKLRDIKSGLMQDLLTGKVRVKVDKKAA